MNIVEFQHVSKRFRLTHERTRAFREIVVDRLDGAPATQEFWALRDVSFGIQAGETLGLIGSNGAGKSTVLKLIAGILVPTDGRVETNGTSAALLELGAGFHPEYTGAENIYLFGSFHGLGRRQVQHRYREIVEFSELGSFIDEPVKHYSSGMYLRLAFSAAIALDPQILLVDEMLAVGDEHFKHKCFQRMSELRRQGTTIILVTHDLVRLRALCSRAIWIEHGMCVADGDPGVVAGAYLQAVAEAERAPALPAAAAPALSANHTNGHVAHTAGASIVEAARPAPSVGKRPLRWLAAWRADLLALAVGFLIMAAAWSPLLSPGHSLLAWGDAVELDYPWWVYTVSEIQAGRLAAWDPYTMGGRSHIGEGPTKVVYPPLLILAAAGGQWATTTGAIQLFAFLHALVGFAGTYILCRTHSLRTLSAVAGGLTFALGGFFALRAPAQVHIFIATAWVPLVLAGAFLVARNSCLRWAMLSGTALGLSLLAGHNQPAFHATLALGLGLAFLAIRSMPAAAPRLGVRRAVLALAISIATAIGLSAAQLLPQLEFLPQVWRWIGVEEPLRGNARIPLDVLAQNPTYTLADAPEILFRWLPHPSDGSLYVGLVAALVALIGATSSRNQARMFWVVLVVIGFGVSLGAATPLLAGVYYLVPLSDKVREPIRYLLLAHLGISMLVALGINRLSWYARPPAPNARAAALLGSIVVSASLVWVYTAQSGDPPPPGVAPLTAFLAVGALLVVGGVVTGRFAPRYGAPLVTAMLAVELGTAWSAAIPRTNADAGAYFASPLVTGLRQFIAAHPGTYRIDFDDVSLPRNLGQVLRVPTIVGYAATRPALLHDLQVALGWQPPSRASDLLGVKFLISARTDPRLPEVGRLESARIYENPQALPLAWFVEDVQTVDNEQAALGALGQADLDPARTVILDTREAEQVAGCYAQGSASAAVLDYAPDLMRVQTQSASRRLLVTSQPVFPGWAVQIDGQPAASVRANYAFTAVCVPAGAHVVEWRYVPRTLILGLLTSLTTLLLLSAIVLRPWRWTSRTAAPGHQPSEVSAKQAPAVHL